MNTKLLPFTKEMIPDAGIVLAKRHQRNRKILPILPDRFESVDVAEKAIKLLTAADRSLYAKDYGHHYLSTFNPYLGKYRKALQIKDSCIVFRQQEMDTALARCGSTRRPPHLVRGLLRMLVLVPLSGSAKLI